MNAKVAIIGAGPAGLMVADSLAGRYEVTVYEQMPTAGRKLLWAGKTGLNVSHTESVECFVKRYRQQAWLEPCIRAFGAQEICQFMAQLGIETYVGSSGRIFPVHMKASVFLRAWLQRLDMQGVQFCYHHQIIDICKNCLKILNKKTAQTFTQRYDAIILACGGGSYKKLGSDGAWQAWFEPSQLNPLYASNVGVECPWSDYMAKHFGKPLKAIGACVVGENWLRGDAIITPYGLESGVIYPLNHALAKKLKQQTVATLLVDLLPWVTGDELQQRFDRQNAKQSLQSRLRKVGLDETKIALFRECTPKSDWQNIKAIAHHIKSLKVAIYGFRPINEAISTGGGVRQEALSQFQLLSNPYVFCAGEMLDFDAPTGGYLLTACFATGRAVAYSVQMFLDHGGCDD